MVEGQGGKDQEMKLRSALSVVIAILVASALVGCQGGGAPAAQPVSVVTQGDGGPSIAQNYEDSVASRAESTWGDTSTQPRVSAAGVPTATPDAGTPGGRGDEGSSAPGDGETAPAASPDSPQSPERTAARTIALDPGHGGNEVGAVFSWGSRPPVVEKDVNLAIALKLSTLLEQAGYRVVLTRDTDRQVNYPPIERTGDDRITVRDDLQARVDIANEARADLFISIHNNGSASPGESGTEVWYSKDRSFGDKNYALARELQSAILQNLLAAGYRSRDRGVKNDSTFRIWQGRAFNIFILGPAREGFHPRATEMPGALGESLFVSYDVEARLLQRDDILDAIAAGYLEGIGNYFAHASN